MLCFEYKILCLLLFWNIEKEQILQELTLTIQSFIAYVRKVTMFSVYDM